LDECSVNLHNQGHEAQQQEILDVLSHALLTYHIPVRILITSRPERQIRESFSKSPLSDITTGIILDDTHNPDADITLFLNSITHVSPTIANLSSTLVLKYTLSHPSFILNSEPVHLLVSC
jgi:hypothetical protein